MWQYWLVHPLLWSISTPLPHSRAATFCASDARIETSGMPSRTLMTRPAAAAFTATPARMAASEGMRKSVPRCPS